MVADREVLRLRLNRGPTVYLAERASNRKLAPVEMVPDAKGGRPHPRSRQPYCSSTTVSIQATCPSSCPFKATPEGRRGCFADAGFTAIKGARMDRAAEGRPGLDVMREEARDIRRAFGGGPVPQLGWKGRGQDLRIHVGGDVSCAEGAELLAEAAADWVRRGGGSVWSFTHRWREVPAKAFGAISVLASVETGDDAVEAHARGYAPAMVVERFPAGHRPFAVGRLKIIPCPAETRQTTCVQCRLCLDQPLHELGLGIAFQVHGPQSVRAAAAVAALMPKGGRMAYAKALEPDQVQSVLAHLQRDGRQSLRDLMAFCRRTMAVAQLEWNDSDLIVCLNAALAKLQASGQVEAKKDLERKVWYHARGGVTAPAPGPRRQPKPARTAVLPLVKAESTPVDEPVSSPALVAQIDPQTTAPEAEEDEADEDEQPAAPPVELAAEDEDDEEQDETDPPPKNIHPSRLMRIAERARAAGTKLQLTQGAKTAEENAMTTTDTMSTSQAAKALGIHPSTISNMIKDGRLRTTGPTGRGIPLAIVRASVDEIMSGKAEPPAEAKAPKAKAKPGRKPRTPVARVGDSEVGGSKLEVTYTAPSGETASSGLIDRAGIQRKLDLLLSCIEEGMMRPRDVVTALALALGAPTPYAG